MAPKSSKPALPDVSAPLPDLNGADDDESRRSLWSSMSYWITEMLSRNSVAFASETKDASGQPKPFSLAQCCNWSNIRTRLLLMCVLDVFGSLYGLASANRVRLISPLLNLTGLCFMWLLVVGMCITALGIVGILQSNPRFLRIFFVWSVCSLVINFVLSSIDLTTIDKQCDFIWTNFDHSAYMEKDRALFAKQCQSYAFVFFSVVMVGIAFARLYYVYLIRAFYISISPDHEGYTRGGGGGSYAPVHSGMGGRAGYTAAGPAVNHASDDEP